MDSFPITRKVRTTFRVFDEGGPSAIWSLIKFKIGAASRTLPGGLVRVGFQRFRPSDQPTRHLLLSGEYEAAERRMVKRYVRRDIPVVEFGASLGIVSCTINRRLKNPKKHVVVEANPEILPLLTENRDRNRCNFEIVHAAAGAEGPTLRLYIGSDTLNSSTLISTGKPVDVPVVSLKGILDKQGFETCAVVCDIEGAELALVKSEIDLFKSRVEVFIAELHPSITGSVAVEESRRLLKEYGFEEVFRDLYTFVFLNSAFANRK